jgi:hypothetical protein
LDNIRICDEAFLKNDNDAPCAWARAGTANTDIPSDAAAEIEKLTELMREGILTPEEWQSAKAKIVGLKQDHVDEAVRLLRALHELMTLGGLTESEYNMKKWDVLSQKLICLERPTILPPKIS